MTFKGQGRNVLKGQHLYEVVHHHTTKRSYTYSDLMFCKCAPEDTSQCLLEYQGTGRALLSPPVDETSGPITGSFSNYHDQNLRQMGEGKT